MGYRNQFVKGTIEMVVLGLLKKEEMYGYQISRELRATSSECLGISEGSLYPLLQRLEDKGMIQGRWVERIASKRKARYYSITNKGRKELEKRKGFWSKLTQAVATTVPGIA